MGLKWFRPNVEKLRRRGDTERLYVALSDERVDYDALIAIGSLGERALGPLLQRLRGGEQRGPLAFAVAMIGLPAVEPLVDLLVSGEEPARRMAMDALALLRDRRAIEPLCRAVKQETGKNRQRAIAALGKIGGTQCFDVVLDALRDDDSIVRRQAASTLGDLHERRAFLTLLAQFEAVNGTRPNNVPGDWIDAFFRHELLFTIAGSLAMLGDPDALANLLRWSADMANTPSRASAARELGRVGGDEAVGVLVGLLRDQHPSVREAAAWALASSNDPRALSELRAVRAKARRNDVKVIDKALRVQRMVASIPPVPDALPSAAYLGLSVFDSISGNRVL